MLNLFAKNIVLEGDKNIVPPLCKVEGGIRPLTLTITPLRPVHVIYILVDIKRLWLSCLIGPFFLFLLRDSFELFDFPFFRLSAYLIGVVPGTRRVHYFRYLRIYYKENMKYSEADID